MTGERIVGDYRDLSTNRRAIKLAFSLPVMEVMNFWSRCGLIANFGASYMAVANPSKKNIANSLSFILNELIENAVKYASPRHSLIELSLLQEGHYFIIDVSNPVSEEQVGPLIGMAEHLIDSEYVNETYIDMLTSSGKSAEKSGIGLLTVINYYNTALSFRIVHANSGGTEGFYEIQARINLEEL